MHRAASRRLGILSLLGVLSAVAAALPATGKQNPSSRPVRVLLGSASREVPLSQTGAWRLVDGSGRVVARDETTERWSVMRDGQRLRVIHADAPASPWVTGSLTLEMASGDIIWQQKSYRGALIYVATDTAVLVVNRADVEDYLRGVLPLEIGARQTSDHAAVEAQAVAARSFTYTKMLASGARNFDVRATESDQVYGGVAVETFWGDLAVAATAGWVLSFRGQVVTAPYHSACGGGTALPSETWRGGQDGYLRSVSDTSPRTGRPWCDIAPRAQWERRLAAADLATAVERNGRDYTAVPPGASASIRDARVEGRTASGRARAIVFTTASGDVTIRGNDIRYVLRQAGGEILPSTAFSLATERGENGQLRGVVLRGRGNGHGVGLCQWGAIARARAGDDFRAILKAYYPGADITRAP
ncbi:MAG TPA: SpoIID/LytB domain-containing protein [Gemmatimonadaceae bacterium]